MSLFLAWVVFPLVMSVLSLGLGLLVETIAGVRLRGTLLLPTGFAVMIVVSGLTTMASATAELTVPAVVALAVAGLLFGFRRARTFDYWPASSALSVFAVFAAPVVFAGSATFTGWIKLDDGATWLAFAHRLVDHGRNVTGLAPSSYEVVLAHNLGNGYPVGAFVPLGVGGKLVSEDLAWLLQPYMAFGAALLALAVYDLVSRVVKSRGLRALVALVAAQGALYYGYALWGGVKDRCHSARRRHRGAHGWLAAGGLVGAGGDSARRRGRSRRRRPELRRRDLAPPHTAPGCVAALPQARPRARSALRSPVPYGPFV